MNTTLKYLLSSRRCFRPNFYVEKAELLKRSVAKELRLPTHAEAWRAAMEYQDVLKEAFNNEYNSCGFGIMYDRFIVDIEYRDGTTNKRIFKFRGSS